MKIPPVRFIVPIVLVLVGATILTYALYRNGEQRRGAPESVSDGVDKQIEADRARAAEYIQQGKNAEALEILLKIEALKPKDLAVHYAVARMYQALGKDAEARAALERGIPYLDDPNANAAYAKLLAELK